MKSAEHLGGDQPTTLKLSTGSDSISPSADPRKLRRSKSEDEILRIRQKIATAILRRSGSKPDDEILRIQQNRAAAILRRSEEIIAAAQLSRRPISHVGEKVDPECGFITRQWLERMDSDSECPTACRAFTAPAAPICQKDRSSGLPEAKALGASLLKVLQDGQVCLVNPDATSSSPNFGVVRL